MVIFNSYVAKQPVIGKFLNNEIGDQPPGHEKSHEKTIGDHDIVRGKDPVGRYRRWVLNY